MELCRENAETGLILAAGRNGLTIRAETPYELTDAILRSRLTGRPDQEWPTYRTVRSIPHHLMDRAHPATCDARRAVTGQPPPRLWTERA
jgi:hypothetical protein